MRTTFTLLARESIATGRGDRDALLAIVDTMLERFPSHAPSLGYRAMALTGLGHFDECLDPPKRALRVGPRDSLVGAWSVLIANCHFRREEYPQAAEYARIAWQASPRLPVPPLTSLEAIALLDFKLGCRPSAFQHRAAAPRLRELTDKGRPHRAGPWWRKQPTSS